MENRFPTSATLRTRRYPGNVDGGFGIPSRPARTRSPAAVSTGRPVPGRCAGHAQDAAVGREQSALPRGQPDRVPPSRSAPSGVVRTLSAFWSRHAPRVQVVGMMIVAEQHGVYAPEGFGWSAGPAVFRRV